MAALFFSSEGQLMFRSLFAASRFVGVGAAMLFALGCGPFDPPPACPDCVGALIVDLHPSSAWPAGAYQMTIQADDVRAVCRGSLPLPACVSRAMSCEPARVVTIAESGCTLPAASHGFAHIVFDSRLRPKRVEVSITRDDTVVAQATLAPVFQAMFPNDHECGAGCDVARAQIDVASR